MGMLKPYTTLGIGILLGYFVAPKVIKMLPIGSSS
jgi:uncharacterized protein YneF (UPF0154 family)